MHKAQVVAAGPIFLDIVSYGLKHAPVPGEEQWVDGGEIMAGGVANQAVACARLGLDVNILTAFGTDRAGRWVRELLDGEDVRFDGSTTVERQSVTIAQFFDGDRALTTWGEDGAPLPPADMPAPDYLLASVPYLSAARDTVRRWREAGTTVIVDSCWDPAQKWDLESMAPIAEADIFVPNEVECLKYTQEDCCFKGAAKFLEAVPALVITRGERGAIVAERGAMAAELGSSRGDEPAGGAPPYTEPTFIELPAITVKALDTTGAGDSFTAGLVRGLVAGASLVEAAVLGQVTAAWTVERPGGSASAPTSEELVRWADSGQLRSADSDTLRRAEGQGARHVPNPADVVRRLLR